MAPPPPSPCTPSLCTCMLYLWLCQAAYVFPTTMLARRLSFLVSESLVFEAFLASFWSLKSRQAMLFQCCLAFATRSPSMLLHLLTFCALRAFPTTNLAHWPCLAASGTIVFCVFVASLWLLESCPVIQFPSCLAFGARSAAMLFHLLFFVLCVASPLQCWHAGPLFRSLKTLFFEHFWRHFGL